METIQTIGKSCFFAHVNRVARLTTQIYDQSLAPVGLTAGQFTMLVVLSSFEEVAVTPMAERLAMDRTTLARNLQPLARDGLIEIRQGEDQRQRLVRLSDKGKATLEQAIPLWEQAQHTVQAQIGVAETQTLVKQFAAIMPLLREGA